MSDILRAPCEIPDCIRPSIGLGRCDKHAVYMPRPKAKRKKAELEGPIKARIRAALVQAGAFVMVHDVDNRLGKTGLGKGVSDIICVVMPLGRFLAVEVKRPGFSPSDVRPDQVRWLAEVRKYGGVAGIATCEIEALDLLALAASPLTARE